ncbi:MAG TPA: class II aldolase/adducin family protein [Caulobacteraceae bacterium]|jgi:ribulose-5-phosphate 4-epimerase/fuculose-1-phosphate aldolase
MADGSIDVRSLKSAVSEGEWQARVNLAALYRLVALEGWDDMIFTHISARVPGEETFLINPYGFFFDEITASSLVKVDLNGDIQQETPHFINAAGFVIHSAIHEARPDAHYVIHLHTDQGVAVSAQRQGLLPITQHAMTCLSQLAYHDYEGIALNLDEKERLVRDLGDKKLMLLRNHGTLSIGASAAEAWLGMFMLERACTQQIMALSAGQQGVMSAQEEAQAAVAQQMAWGAKAVAQIAWPGLLRKAARRSPGFDA